MDSPECKRPTPPGDLDDGPANKQAECVAHPPAPLGTSDGPNEQVDRAADPNVRNHSFGPPCPFMALNLVTDDT